MTEKLAVLVQAILLSKNQAAIQSLLAAKLPARPTLTNTRAITFGHAPTFTIQFPLEADHAIHSMHAASSRATQQYQQAVA
jgi:hypothetical protein